MFEWLRTHFLFFEADQRDIYSAMLYSELLDRAESRAIIRKLCWALFRSGSQWKFGCTILRKSRRKPWVLSLEALTAAPPAPVSAFETHRQEPAWSASPEDTRKDSDAYLVREGR